MPSLHHFLCKLADFATFTLLGVSDRHLFLHCACNVCLLVQTKDSNSLFVQTHQYIYIIYIYNIYIQYQSIYEIEMVELPTTTCSKLHGCCS